MAVLTKITSRSLADNAVTSSHVQADVIAAGDIAAGAITSSELADDAVGAAQLASDAVVDASVASGAAIGLTKLATTGALSATSLAVTGTITGNPKATNATTVAATYGNEQERVHGTTFTTTGSTVTGDVVFESLTDEAVTLSGTGTITGSGGRIIMKGLENVPVRTSSQGGFTEPISAPYINAGKASFGETSIGDAILKGDASLAGTLTSGTIGTGVTFPIGSVIQVDGANGAAITSSTSQYAVQKSMVLKGWPNSKVFIIAAGRIVKDSGGDSAHGRLHVNPINGTAGDDGPRYSQQFLYQQANTHEEVISISHWDMTPERKTTEYGIWWDLSSGNWTIKMSMSLFEVMKT